MEAGHIGGQPVHDGRLAQQDHEQGRTAYRDGGSRIHTSAVFVEFRLLFGMLLNKYTDKELEHVSKGESAREEEDPLDDAQHAADIAAVFPAGHDAFMQHGLADIAVEKGNAADPQSPFNLMNMIETYIFKSKPPPTDNRRCVLIVRPEVLIQHGLIPYKVKIEETERICQFIMFFPLADAKGNIPYDKITGNQRVQLLGQNSAGRNTQFFTDFLSRIACIPGVQQFHNGFYRRSVLKHRSKQSVIFISENSLRREK